MTILSDPCLSTADSTPEIFNVALEITVRMPCGPRAPKLLGPPPDPSGQGSSHHPSQEQDNWGGTGVVPAPATCHVPGDEVSVTDGSCRVSTTNDLQLAGILVFHSD